MPTIEMKNIRSLTLYTGEKGPNQCVCHCPCCSQTAKNSLYQGTIEQFVELIGTTPNLKQLYILGNPDPCVDTSFCNLIAQVAVSKGIHVCFSTSGVGGEKTIKQLLNGIFPDMVDYISFSIDSVRPEKMSMLKGINYPWSSALRDIEWCVRRGYPVRVQPTLWSCNFLEAGEIVSFFASKGVNVFNFHIGSLESRVDLETHRHLTPEEINLVHMLLQIAARNYSSKVTCPTVIAGYGRDDSSKWYCSHPEDCSQLLAFLRADGIFVTNVPIAASVDTSLAHKINADTRTIEVKNFSKDKFCPFSHQLSGRADTVCRYVSQIWDYR